MIIKLAGLFIGLVSFSLLIEVPKNFLVATGAVGAVGGLVFEACADLLQMGNVAASFFSALVVAFLSHMLARKFKAPVTLFLVAGILPTVPGAGMYRIVYSMIMEGSKLTGYYFVETIEIAGVIALAIFLMDSVFRVFKKGWRQKFMRS